MDAKKAVESGDTSRLFEFAVELSKEAARHVPIRRLSFGKSETMQSEQEFLMWHATCCINELLSRSDFSLSGELRSDLHAMQETLQQHAK